jgi:hypothetical protein
MVILPCVKRPFALPHITTPSIESTTTEFVTNDIVTSTDSTISVFAADMDKDEM